MREQLQKVPYAPPRILTLSAREVVASLGPASAGSSKAAPGGIDPSTSSCGFPMGYPCP
jgi:hypothetical protein